MVKSRLGGKPDSATASTASPSRKTATFFSPRMLTPSEIEFLKQNAQQTVETVRRNMERNKAG